MLFIGNTTNLDLKILISEMEMMATIGCHTNVIGFLGACTTGNFINYPINLLVLSN